LHIQDDVWVFALLPAAVSPEGRGTTHVLIIKQFYQDMAAQRQRLRMPRRALNIYLASLRPLQELVKKNSIHGVLREFYDLSLASSTLKQGSQQLLR
jgi:hypothetical protein